MPYYLTDEFSRHDEYTAATVSRAGLDGGAGNWRCRFFSNRGIAVAASCDHLRGSCHPTPLLAKPHIDISAGRVRFLFAPQFSDRRYSGLKRTKILFVSDSGCATEKSLLASRSDLRSDVLVKGQHHSGNSGSDVFLDAVRPRLIVATSRDFPQQERISDEWAGQVRARNIKLFRQDETGAVELEFGEREWQARAYLTGEIFRSANR
jgi:hypothetical protein